MCGVCHTGRVPELDAPYRHLPALASDRSRLQQLFGQDELLPLWVAEPYVPLAQPIRDAIEERAKAGWYGYETRPGSVNSMFHKSLNHISLS